MGNTAKILQEIFLKHDVTIFLSNHAVLETCYQNCEHKEFHSVFVYVVYAILNPDCQNPLTSLYNASWWVSARTDDTHHVFRKEKNKYTVPYFSALRTIESM